MELYCVEVTDDYTIMVDIKYPGIGYKIGSLKFQGEEVTGEITPLQPSDIEIPAHEVPEDVDAHAGEVFKEYLLLLEKWVKESYNL